jgi:hypothetical protein
MKLTAIQESTVQQMSDVRWTSEIESPERRAFAETLCGENSYLPTSTKSFGKAQISNHFAIVSPNQTIVSNQKVVIVSNKRETISQPIGVLNEFD